MSGKSGCWLAAGLLALSFVGCRRPAKPWEGVMSVEKRQSLLVARLGHKFEDAEAHLELGRIYQQQGRLSDAEFHYKMALRFDPVYWAAQAAMVKLLEAKGNSAGAQQAAETFINAVGNSADRSIELGRAFEKEQLLEYALRCYQQALRLEPKSPKPYARLGYFYKNKGDMVRAREYFEKSFNLDWNQPDVVYELGRMGVRIEVPRTEPKKPVGGEAAKKKK